MKSLLKLFQLNFLPRSVDLALLILRVWLGLTLLLNHGWAKLMTFGQMAPNFADPLGVGRTQSLSMAVFGEVVCSVLLVLGLFTRFASLVLTVVMAVAFFMVHQRILTGTDSGELAFVYLAGFVTLFLAGGGQFSIDRKLGAKA